MQRRGFDVGIWSGGNCNEWAKKRRMGDKMDGWVVVVVVVVVW